MLYKTKISISGFENLIANALLELLQVSGKFIVEINPPPEFEPVLSIIYYDAANKINIDTIVSPAVIIYRGVKPQVNDASNIITIAMPFRYAELETSIWSLLRQQEESKMAALCLNGYEFNPQRRSFIINDKEELKLTDKEIEILIYLNQAGAPVARDELLREVWRYNDGVTTHTLETHIYRLRQKLAQALGSEDLLLTEDGGYSLKKD